MSRLRWFAWFAWAGALLVGCGRAEAIPGPDAESEPPRTCGRASARGKCESITWPRLIVSLGDPGARQFEYFVTTDDGRTLRDAFCPSGFGESEAFVCDLGFYAGQTQRLFTLHAIEADAGQEVASKAIPLTEFNYCGDGVAYVVVTSTEARKLAIGEPRYLSVCGAL